MANISIFSSASTLETFAGNPTNPNGKILSNVNIFQSFSISITSFSSYLDCSIITVVSFLSVIFAKTFGKGFFALMIAKVSFQTYTLPLLK